MKLPRPLPKWRIDLWLWIARRVPWELAYWCTIVVFAHATTGKKFGSTVAPELTVSDALQRWPLCRHCGALRSHRERNCPEAP